MQRAKDIAGTYSIRGDFVQCWQSRNAKLAPLVLRRPPSIHDNMSVTEQILVHTTMQDPTPAVVQRKGMVGMCKAILA